VGATQLQRIQVGKETVKGTAVTTGKILTGILGQIADTSQLQITQNTYQTGLMGGSNQGTPVFVSDTAEIALSGDFTAENAVYLLNAGWGSATPATTAAVLTAGWAFNAPTTAINSPTTFTTQTGDNSEQLKATYGLISDWEIKGAVNDIWKYTGKMMLRSATAASTGFDTATPLAATPFVTNLTKVFVDPASGTVGTTQLTATVREFSVKPKSGFHQKQFQDGVLYPTSDGQAQPAVTLDLILEYNGSAIALRNAWKTTLQKRVRILNGTTVSATPAAWIDVTGYFTKFDPIGDKDGNTIVAAHFDSAPAGTTSLDFTNFGINNILTGGL
jgi:hypothetical protein